MQQNSQVEFMSDNTYVTCGRPNCYVSCRPLLTNCCSMYYQAKVNDIR